MNTFKMMIGRLCLLLILRTHEQPSLLLSSVSLSSSFFESYAFMKERADVFDEISLLSSPFCSSFFFSRL